MEKGINKQLPFGEVSIVDSVRFGHTYDKIVKLLD